MNWSNVRLIFSREVRDQLRDRRTLFMIFVLPILLYPLLGMSFFQIAQFVREHPTRILVAGAERLPAEPALLVDGQFAGAWFYDSETSRLLDVELADPEQAARIEQDPQAAATEILTKGAYQAVLYVPPEFAERLAEYRAAVEERRADPAADVTVPTIVDPEVFHNSAKEPSQIAYARLRGVLDRWRDKIGGEIVEAAGLPESARQPFASRTVDVADEGHRDAAMWSKVFPFLLLIWALTGAFYPAVDLCAGEKERGTLETLLSSPAERSEIVLGKLLTIMLFSIATVILNLTSMGITGLVVFSQLEQLGQMGQFGPPPLLSLVWLLVALVPVAALYSALCLALAAFARSSKEGQYYLMPLVLVTMPLVILPMAPGVELTLGNSLIPITGIMLLLRTVVEGNYATALPYVIPVTAVTLGCCWLAIRWAIDQFNTESVLFRESERVGLGAWLRHLIRDRGDTPTIQAAVFCGVLILLIRFFMSFAMPLPTNFNQFARLALVTQLVVIATPALLLTVMLTRSPRKTLLLHRPAIGGLLAAGLLAVCMHPLAIVMQAVVMKLYPVSDDLAAVLNQLISGPQNVWQMLLVIAVVPAVCEELAFRGFVLSGFRHWGHKWRAIIFTSVLFAISHTIFQQSLIAFFLGLVIGYVAVQTGSVFPCIVLHATHNALVLVPSRFDQAWLDAHPSWQWAFASLDGAFIYDGTIIAAAALGAAALLYWFHRLPYLKTAEETLQEAIDHSAARAAAG